MGKRSQKFLIGDEAWVVFTDLIKGPFKVSEVYEKDGEVSYGFRSIRNGRSIKDGRGMKMVTHEDWISCTAQGALEKFILWIESENKKK
jgi:hypothetical protein